jgi:hypothetical protein
MQVTGRRQGCSSSGRMGVVGSVLYQIQGSFFFEEALLLLVGAEARRWRSVWMEMADAGATACGAQVFDVSQVGRSASRMAERGQATHTQDVPGLSPVCDAMQWDR